MSLIAYYVEPVLEDLHVHTACIIVAMCHANSKATPEFMRLRVIETKIEFLRDEHFLKSSLVVLVGYIYRFRFSVDIHWGGGNLGCCVTTRPISVPFFLLGCTYLVS